MTMLRITILLSLLLSSTWLYAHPGRTASDGCHYCRTNCDKWGVPWNVRHCHHHIDPLLKIPVDQKKIVEKKSLQPS